MNDHRHLVLLGCGHWFTEHYDGEALRPELPRVCGDFDHYPRQFAAVYLPVCDTPPPGRRG